MTEFLSETTTSTPVKKSNGWTVTIARPGAGSTGNYSAEMLAEYGPVAFPAKTKAYFKHNTPQDRDPRDGLGIYPDGAYWDAEAGELRGRLVPYKRWDALLEEIHEVGDSLAVSMYALDWDKDDQGNVTRIGYHRANSIDAVSAPGLVGSGVRERLYESLVESARSAYLDEKPGEQVAQERKESNKMEEKLDKLIALFETFVTEQKTAAAESAKVESAEKDNEQVVAETLDARLAALQSIDDASGDLLASQIKSLRESARKGEDVAPLIESAKAVVTEFKALSETSVQGGGVRVGNDTKISTPKGW